MQTKQELQQPTGHTTRMSPLSVCLSFAMTITSQMSYGTAVAEDKRQNLTPQEAEVVTQSMVLIRNCQLPDGGLNIVDHGKRPGAPVWIAPYFANHAACALLAYYRFEKDPGDLERVARWLDWCVNHQEKGGYWCDYIGTVAQYKSNGKVDAHDSSAALFLLVLEQYREAGGEVTPKMREAAKASLGCIQNVTHKDGLTWAKPDYGVKCLVDNIEVYAGLTAAKSFFAAMGDQAEAKAASDQVVKIGPLLQGYWQAVEVGRFAWVLHANGVFEGGLKSLYPHGFAQLVAVAFIKGEQKTFLEVTREFKPEILPHGIGAERYLLAASRLGGQQEQMWRFRVVQDASGFAAHTVYIHRPALVVLGLLEGADWMPSVARTGKLDR